jgi:hypothetical protein
VTFTRVVHCKKEPFDIYVGRQDHGCHFGNAFAHKKSKYEVVVVATVEEAVLFCKQWLEGTAWQHIEPIRRRWILDNLHSLKGRTLGCFCKPGPCHGDVLAELADRS